MRKPTLHQRLDAWTMNKAEKAMNKVYDPFKRKLIGQLKGTILEIGPGAGSNIRYLPKCKWIGLEPNPAMHSYLRKKLRRYGVKGTLRKGTAERIPLPDKSVDSVVGTLVFCEIRDREKAIKEIKRVLKPGGRYVFIEHVAARTYFLRSLQNMINPVWRWSTGGCNCNRETERLLRSFRELTLRRHRLPLGLSWISPHIVGTAKM